MTDYLMQHILRLRCDLIIEDVMRVEINGYAAEMFHYLEIFFTRWLSVAKGYD